ncbi:MAG: site-specific integrase [Terracidiphilus sp.]
MDETGKEREWEHGTSNRYKSSLSTVYREAIRAGKVSDNPVKLVRRYKEPLGRVRFLDEPEETQLRQIIKAPLRGRINDDGISALAQFDVALNTGMRRSEQFSVTMDQVNEKSKTIYLEKTKNGSDRHVKLNSEALRVIGELKARHKQLGLPPDSLLFISKRNEPIKNPRKWFETIVAAAGLKDVTWHTLRHTFASRLVMEGVNLKTVQELMGHKTIAMTARYAHLAPGYLETELETLVQRHNRETEKAEKNQVPAGPDLVPGASERRSCSSQVIDKTR